MTGSHTVTSDLALLPQYVRDRVSVNDATGCFDWTHMTSNGYGFMWDDDNKPVTVHRWLARMLAGRVLEGQRVRHLCRRRICVRPSHLVFGSKPSDWQTHCKRGHPFDASNTYVPPAGDRRCRACNAEQCREYRKRKAASPPSGQDADRGPSSPSQAISGPNPHQPPPEGVPARHGASTTTEAPRDRLSYRPRGGPAHGDVDPQV